MIARLILISVLGALLPVAPGEVCAHSNEGDARCGEAPWAKSRHLRSGVASLLATLPAGSSAEELVDL